MPELLPIAQDAFVADVRALADRIIADAWRPDFIVGIGRGGLTPAVYLSHATGLPMLTVDYSSRLSDFSDAPLGLLRDRSCAGTRLLFVDDINDSGRTICQIRAKLAEGRADNIRFATLIDNIRSSARVDYAARTIDRSITRDWFVFPWEAVAPRAAVEADALAVPEQTD